MTDMAAESFSAPVPVDGDENRYVVGTTADFPPGTGRIVPLGGSRGIGVFNLQGSYYALKNVCPHQGGPLCMGLITGTTEPRYVAGDYPELEWVKDGEILRCPWHKWEFEIRTGRTIFESRFHVSSYPVSVLTADERERLIGGVETFPVTVSGDLVIVDLATRPMSGVPQELAT